MDRQAPGRPGGDRAPAAGERMAGVDAAEFAEYLRAERERRRLTLEQVAEETKIASKHLAALERGDVRNWPGGMYRRAMMRAYAESIGVDRELALKQFEQAFEPAKKPTAAPAALAEHSQQAPRLPVPHLPPPHLPPPNLQLPRLPLPHLQLPRWRPSRGQMRVAGSSLLAVVALFIVWRLVGSLTSSRIDETSDAAATAAAPAAAGVAAGSAASGNAADTVAIGAAPRSAAAISARVPAAPATAPAARPSGRAAVDAAATTGVAEPRVLATEGTLVVASDPPGARVTVNGIGWGDTPVTIRHLEFGEKRIRLTMQGYVSAERSVHLGPERGSANVRLTLRER